MLSQTIQFIILCIFWALHAYIIHPYMVMREYKKCSQDEKWVRVILKVPHELLLEKIEGSQVNVEEVIGKFQAGSEEVISRMFTGFAEELGGCIDGSLQAYLKGVQGAVLGPLSKQAKEIEGQIQEQIDEATEQIAAPGVNLPGFEKNLARLYKRYPLFGDIMAAKQVSDQLLPQRRAGDGGVNVPGVSGRHDF